LSRCRDEAWLSQGLYLARTAPDGVSVNPISSHFDLEASKRLHKHQYRVRISAVMCAQPLPCGDAESSEIAIISATPAITSLDFSTRHVTHSASGERDCDILSPDITEQGDSDTISFTPFHRNTKNVVFETIQLQLETLKRKGFDSDDSSSGCRLL
jgi:hypothetical protein